MSIWKSIKGFFGQTIHYKDGVKVGETWNGLIPGTKDHYDANGGLVGYSTNGVFADELHFNAHGGRIGESWKDDFGVTRHYNDNGFVGASHDGIIGETSYISDDADALFNQPSGSDDVYMTPQPYDDPDW